MKLIPPEEVLAQITQEQYQRWVRAKAQGHARRDRRRDRPATAAQYVGRIHDAVLASAGRCAYTDDPLLWKLVGTYNNEASRSGRGIYKSTFDRMPTVDHYEDGTFRLTSWLVNDAKGQMTESDFLALCRKVCNHKERS